MSLAPRDAGAASACGVMNYHNVQHLVRLLLLLVSLLFPDGGILRRRSEGLAQSTGVLVQERAEHHELWEADAAMVEQRVEGVGEKKIAR